MLSDEPYLKLINRYDLDRRGYTREELDGLGFEENGQTYLWEEVRHRDGLEFTFDRQCQGEREGKFLLRMVSGGGKVLWNEGGHCYRPEGGP